MTQVHRSLDAKLYIQSDGVAGIAGWVEVGNVRDLTLGIDISDFELSTRGGDGWRQYTSALKDAEVSFGMVYDSTDTELELIRAAAFSTTGTQLGFKILDGGTTDTDADGFVADFVITQFNIPQNLEEGLIVDVVMKPARTITPAWQESV